MTCTIPLGELITIRGGGTPSRSIPAYWNGTIRWATVKDFKSTELAETQESITPEGICESATNVIPAGSVIVPTRMAVGKAAINTIDLAINQDLKALLPGGKVDPRFLLHFMLDQGQYLESQAQGATVKGIKLDLLRSLPFPEISLSEQRRMAAILDKADAIRRKREQALALADEYLRSVFLEMFGDPVRNPKNFSVLPFSKLVTAIDSGFSPKCEARPATSEEFGVLKVSSVSSTQFRAEENKAVFPNFQPKSAHLIKNGDLLFSRKNTYELVGASALVEIDTENLALPDLIFRLVIDPTKVTKEFLWAMLVQPSMREQLRKIASGAAASMPNIGKGRLLELEVIAPEFQLQQDFSAIYAKSRSMLVNQKAHQTEATNLFAALSQRAFRGEL